MFVVGWDSVAVEGWLPCFLVGCVVVFRDKIGDFAELILSEMKRPGFSSDRFWRRVGVLSRRYNAEFKGTAGRLAEELVELNGCST